MKIIRANDTYACEMVKIADSIQRVDSNLFRLS